MNIVFYEYQRGLHLEHVRKCAACTAGNACEEGLQLYGDVKQTIKAIAVGAVQLSGTAKP